LQKADAAPPGATSSFEFLLQFLPNLIGWPFVELILVFFKKIKNVWHGLNDELQAMNDERVVDSFIAHRL